MDIKNNCVSSQTEIIQGLYAGGIAGEISSYNENSPTVVLMTNHLANNIVNAGKIIGSNEDPPAIGYARRIVGRSIIELGLNYLFSPPLGYIAYNTYMFDSNYANPNTLIVGNNQLDDINPGMNYGQPGEPVDADADPDYGANRMQGANFVESVLPDGWKYDECLKPAFDPDETVPDQARCTDMPSARSADDRPAPIAKAAPPQATASLATSSAKAFTSVVNSIASMEYGLQKMLKAGASIVNLGVENNASPSDMAEYSGLAAHIVEGARDTEGKLLDKLCCSMAYLQSYMDHECSNESGGGDCPKRWQIRMNTVLCDLDFSVQAQFIITNTVTNEITRVVTDANGHLVLDLYAGEYTMTLYDTGENNLAPDTRRIIVGGDGTYFVGGEMIRHPETGICDLCLALAPLSDYSPPETGE
ncbi:MAG: hypothetical protein LBS72_02510 [Oscillospiraceae bacterium]|nr:hypothetical protein [Oscillospiraceae bacterium]